MFILALGKNLYDSNSARLKELYNMNKSEKEIFHTMYMKSLCWKNSDN